MNLPTTNTSSFNFNTPKPAGTGGISFGSTNLLSTAAAQQQPAGTAAPTTSTPLFFGATGTTTNPTPSSGIALDGTSTTGAIPPKTSASVGFSISNPTSTAIGIGGVAAPAPVATSSVVAPNVDPSKTSANLTTTTTTTASTAVASQINFCQLEELNNKWTLELEELEKMFLNQATQVNSWDTVLENNSNKIISLSDAIEKVKIEQTSLEKQLESIAAQHTELDECITPLQKELAKIPHSEKGQTYSLAESLDTQLHQMSEDLKEVIEHLNEANKSQDTNDPIVQIGQILNAHMSSLQWIESTAGEISTKIDDVTKMHESMRRDNERSFRLTYND